MDKNAKTAIELMESQSTFPRSALYDAATAFGLVANSDESGNVELGIKVGNNLEAAAKTFSKWDNGMVCEKHPMLLRKALSELVGAGSQKELDETEAGVKLLPKSDLSDADRATMLNAIHALRETAPKRCNACHGIGSYGGDDACNQCGGSGVEDDDPDECEHGIPQCIVCPDCIKEYQAENYARCSSCKSLFNIHTESLDIDIESDYDRF